jgi:ATP-dependent helicase/nuclease subunit A
VVWAGKKAEDPPAVAAARAAMLGETEDEYRRLLYVAMTRAADRLIVGGCMPGNRNVLRPLSWYDLIEKGLGNSGLHVQNVPPPDGVVKRFSRAEDASPPAVAASAQASSTAIPLPMWLRAPAPREVPIDNFVRPSDSDEETGHVVRTGEAAQLRAIALLRGKLVHRLLQSLPDVPSEGRLKAALRYLARNAGDWAKDERETLAAQVLSLIGDTRFAAVFAPGSRAEVSIVGRVAPPGRTPVLVSGQIDRLVVTPAEVLIVDYKTNHAPPATVAEAPAAYIRQLALYRAVLARLYLLLPIRAALLWTETPEMMEIPAPALDAQLATISQRDDRA